MLKVGLERVPSTLIGEVVCQVSDSGAVAILEAPRYARVAAFMVGPPDGWSQIRMDGDCIVLAEQVWYLPIGEEDGGRVLICELVRDDRT